MGKRPSSCSALEAAAPAQRNPSYLCFMHSGESNTFQSHMSCRLCGPARVSKVKCARSGERFCSQCAHDMCPEILAQKSGNSAIPLDGPQCFSCFRADMPIAQYGCEVTLECDSKGTIWLCAECKGFQERVPCPHCWASVLERACFRCGGALDFSAALKSR